MSFSSVKYSSFSSIIISEEVEINGAMILLNFSGEAVATATVGMEPLLSNAIRIDVTECGSKIAPNSSCKDLISFLISSSKNVLDENT